MKKYVTPPALSFKFENSLFHQRCQRILKCRATQASKGIVFIEIFFLNKRNYDCQFIFYGNIRSDNTTGSNFGHMRNTSTQTKPTKMMKNKKNTPETRITW